jgi:hypothetical protein
MKAIFLGRRQAVLALLLMLGLVGSSFGPAPVAVGDDVGGPVGAPTVAYHAMKMPKRVDHPRNKAIKNYKGPKLKVQAVVIPREAAEPTIGVTKKGNAFFAAAEFDSAFVVLPRTKVMKSSDGGLTWKDASPEIPAGDNPPVTADPYVYVEEDSGRIFSLDLYAGCAYLQYSDDEGKTWDANPAACGDMVNDHQTMISGPKPEGFTIPGNIGLPSDYKEILYYCFNRVADSSCGRSFDGGQTFTKAGQPAFRGVDDAGELCGGLHGHIQTDSEGRLFLPKGHCGDAWVAISEDAGESWKQVKISPKHLRVCCYHTSMAVDAADNLYYMWWSKRRRLPYLSISRNSGKTWSVPRMVAPPGVEEVNIPTIAAGDRGRIVITFPGGTKDDRKKQDSTRPWNAYTIVSTNALSKNPTFVSTTANLPSDPIHRGNCGDSGGSGRCSGMYDFLDVIVSPAGDHDFWATFVDTCIDLCAQTPTGPANAMQGIAVRQLSGPRLFKR